MATRSVVGYKNEQGEIRGTYVHWDGYPDNALVEISKRIESEGVEGFKEWVEAGVEGTGYSSYEDNIPYNDGGVNNASLTSEEYGYLVHDDGSVTVEHGLDDDQVAAAPAYVAAHWKSVDEYLEAHGLLE